MLDARPSKKQHELLSYIEGFIKGNGYGPSYREIMRALDYKSVSTVAVHVDGLIATGLLRKKDNSARSLELVTAVSVRSPREVHLDWLEDEAQKLQTGETTKKDAEVVRAALTILRTSS
jgi:SOS-response transcriptional repressor LexA